MTYPELEKEWCESAGLLCRTSGSTGAPKTIFLEKSYLLESARRTCDYFNLTPSSLLYSCISPDFIGGKMMFVRQQLSGCGLMWEAPSNRPVLDTHGRPITLLSVVPSQLVHILDNLHNLPPVDNILVGGAPVPASIRQRVVETDLNVFESYGMTETASHIALRRVTIPQTPFRTLNDINVEEINGVLKINIPHRHSVVTNDCAHVLNNHEFFITGRSDNIIISGGRKINPEAIEEKLSAYIDEPFYISSLPDEKWGERLVLVIESKTNDTETFKIHIVNIVNKYLSGWEKPKEIFVVPSFARTSSGKIKRLSILTFPRDTCSK